MTERLAMFNKRFRISEVAVREKPVISFYKEGFRARDLARQQKCVHKNTFFYFYRTQQY